MKAKSRIEFEGTWNEHIRQLIYLCHSLKNPASKQKVLRSIKQLKALVKEAADEVFPKSQIVVKTR